MANDLLEAAQYYAECGLSVFPVWSVADDGVHCACGDLNCASVAKHPVTASGFKNATQDAEQITRWWATSAHNIGLVARGTGFYPSDVDDKNGHQGSETFRQLTAGQVMPETVEVITPSGSKHYWWIATDYPDYQQLKYGVNALGDGVDVPNYILAPPSRTPAGPYRWAKGHSLDDLEPAVLPAYLAVYETSKANNHTEIPASVDGAISRLVRYGLDKASELGSRDFGCYEMCLYARDSDQMGEAQAQTFLPEYVREVNRLHPKDHAFTSEKAEQQLHAVYSEGRRDPPFEGKKGRRGHNHNDDDPVVRVNTIRAAEVVEVPVRWLWKNYIPLGETTLLEGLPDLGKSTVTLLIAARVTQGHRMPDGTESELEGPANVIILSCEDNPATTIVPRLRIAGADLSRVILVKSASTASGSIRQLEIPEDIILLRQAIAEHSAKLVIIDPLVGYISGRVNTNSDAQVRRAMTPLNEMSHDYECAVVAIRHHTKDSKQTDIILRGGGSIGITGSVRSLLAFMRDPEDPEHSPRRFLALGKHNLAPDGTKTLVFEMIGMETMVAGVERSLPLLSYAGADERSGNTILEALAMTAPRGGGKLKEAFDFVEQLLADGQPMNAADIMSAASEAGINEGTLGGCRNRLKKQGRLIIDKVGSGGKSGKGYWTWTLKPLPNIHLVDHRVDAVEV